MTTPTNENRDTERAEPEPRQRLDISVTKIAAGASAAAIAAAVGSKLGVAGTIVGAAVASVVSTSASTLIGHSLERGKTAARKAMPDQTRVYGPVALTRVEEPVEKPSLADRALADSGLDETVVHDGVTHTANSSANGSAIGTTTVLLPTVTPPDAPRTWKDRIPGRKPLIAAAVASFMLGTGAVTALEVARKGEFPGYHSNVFTNDPGQSGGSHDQPSQHYPGGSGTHKGSTPSQKPDSSSPTSSGSSSSAPSTTPSTPPTSDSTPNTPTTPSTSPSTGPTTPAATPTTPPTGSQDPTTGASTPGATTPSASATGLGKATPTGGASSG